MQKLKIQILHIKMQQSFLIWKIDSKIYKQKWTQNVNAKKSIQIVHKVRRIINVRS